MTDENTAQSELDKIADQIQKIQDENKSLYQNIAMQGAALDTATIMMVRLETLLDSVFDPVTRAKFELRFEHRLNQEMKELQSHLNRAKLTMPGQLSDEGNGLIHP